MDDILFNYAAIDCLCNLCHNAQFYEKNQTNLVSSSNYDAILSLSFIQCLMLHVVLANGGNIKLHTNNEANYNNNAATYNCYVNTCKID